MNQNLKNKFILFLSLYQILLLLSSYWFGFCLHEIVDSPYKFPNIDKTYWLIHFLGIVQFFSKLKTSSVFLEILLFALPIAIFFIKTNRLLVLLNILLLFLFEILYNTNSLHHYHSILSLIFGWFTISTQSAKSQKLMFNFFILYGLFIFWSAGFWKLGRSSFLHPNQLNSIIIEQNVVSLYLEPNSFFNLIRKFLINRPLFSDLIYKSVVLFQISFIIPCLTNKFDRFYIFGLFLFFIFNLVLMNIFSLIPLLIGFGLYFRSQINNN
jgi:hypothetical protein